jgi:phosphorylcholine metabolism protein LicD
MKILLAFLILIIISLSILSILLYRKKEYKKCEKCKECYDNIQLVQFALKKCMKDFDKICYDNNISYWADGGTLLGAVRDKGIIPHDDDLDICIFQEDFDKLSIILNTHPVYELILYDNFIYKIKRRDMNANVWIDVFIVSKNNEGVIRYIKKEHSDKWPKFYYKESEVYPLKRIPFEDHYISVPNDPVPYLERGYGKSWKTPVVYNRHENHNF